MKRSLFWFRNDLRFADHAVLNRASEQSDELAFIYIFDERSFENGLHGGSRIDGRRAYFIWEALQDLKSELKARGSDLLILQGSISPTLERLIHENDIDSLYFSKHVGWEERQDEEYLTSINGLTLHSDWTHMAIDINDLPFTIRNSPDVFTPFRKKIEKYHSIPKPVEKPNLLPKAFTLKGASEVSDFRDLGFEVPEFDNRSVIDFHGGEDQAISRLNHYFWETEAISEYKETRNGMLGANYSSKFSPWLACGNLSPRTVFAELERYEAEHGANESTYWLKFELLWRDYFQIVALKQGAQLYAEFGWKGMPRTWSTNRVLFEKWKNGNTGDSFVDANMKELNSTGFMSNRGRQNVASFLTHQYKVDWRWGASYFEEKLIDYDVASNWGNWSYVSGTGNDPRKDRVFNTALQSERYDPNGDFVRTWLKSD